MSNDHMHGSSAEPKPIPLPDGRWVEVKGPLERVCHEDAWSDPMSAILEPAYEQGLAVFIAALVASGRCSPSGTARFVWVHGEVTARATGDLFDWTATFIDREVRPHDPMDEVTVDDAFGKSPRRCMNHLKARAHSPREKLLEQRLLWRMCWLSLARKIWLARAGYPEFLKPYAP